MAAGENRKITAAFPENYLNAELAGKTAEFDVTAKTIEQPAAVTIDDAFAKSLGLDSLDKLREAVKERLAREHAAASRQRVKRKLLDQLDTLHPFAPPPTLVDDEFDSVWRTVEGDLKQQNRTFEDEGTTEEKAREEYRGIAERRVRLGLVLAEIGERNNIKVSDEEIQRAIVERARQLPGREQEVWDFYRKNPQAVASIRAPIYEEKVVDFLLELARVTDKEVTREELFKEEEDEKAA
jgi:trigger factor